MTPARIIRVYLTLLVLETLAASLIWGVNTLFLLDGGLSLTGAFVANAAFTAGMVLFEIPTGTLADTYGRRLSFLAGAATLLVTTLLYLWLWWVEASLLWWIVVSALIGLGFTFFSGATEAWLVDALEATGYEGDVDSVFGRGQVVMGAATLVGTIAGGVMAQGSLGIPYLVRSALLLVVIAAAAVAMRDLGFQPARRGSVGARVRSTVRASVRHGLGNPPVRLFMLAAPFYFGVSIWVFYAFQPYLLALFGDLDATWLIPSEQRATVLSFASLMGSAGGVVAQPALGRVADVWSLGTGYVVAGALYAVRVPLLLGVRLLRQPADAIVPATTDEGEQDRSPSEGSASPTPSPA